MPDFRLIRGGVILGLLTRTGGDFPWYHGSFEAMPEFEEARPLFDEEQRILDAEDIDGWEGLWSKITAPGLVLESVDGREAISEFLVHIEGTAARWRY